MPIPFQKYLGWLQRFYYQSPFGTIPFPTPTISIEWDWPLVPTTIAPASYLTIAGTVSTEAYAPAIGKHGLVTALQIISTGATFPITDDLALDWDRNPTAAPGFMISRVRGTALFEANFIGGQNIQTGVAIRGVSPVYVPAGNRLVISHTSVAGGITAAVRVQVYELPDFQPLRLP